MLIPCMTDSLPRSQAWPCQVAGVIAWAIAVQFVTLDSFSLFQSIYFLGGMGSLPGCLGGFLCSTYPISPGRYRAAWLLKPHDGSVITDY
jgi:hypothetical protein